MLYISPKDLLAALIIAAGAEDIDPKKMKAGPLDDAMTFLMEDGTLDSDTHHLSSTFIEAQNIAREYLKG